MEEQGKESKIEAIRALFQMRDEAIMKRDMDMLTATQLPDIPYSAIIGYLNMEQLQTTILTIADDTEVTKVVFVNEDYGTHNAYMLYYIVNTMNGWKIYNAASAQG
jgi:hypothetical protein